MVKLLQVAFALAGLLALTAAFTHPGHDNIPRCRKKTAHKPWQMLSRKEKKNYIKAELCLMSKPSKLDVENAYTLWDDLQWNHIVQAHVVHDVGHFLPWHRYYFVLHGRLLRDECGYRGPLPYWDETADAGLSNLLDSPIFQSNAFGGDGSGNTSEITTGPFANYKLHLWRANEPPRETRIVRNLNVSQLLVGTTQSYLDACFLKPNYDLAWECWHGETHTAGHLALGGLNADVALGPGDPMFFLHHGWLDAMWWKWQSLDLPARLTDIGGRKVAGEAYLEMQGLGTPGPEYTDYDGSPGHLTTLDHVLYGAGVAPNVTVRDVMDVRTGYVCADIFFSNSFTVPPGA